MIIAKSTESTVVFHRANGDVVLRKRPTEPRFVEKDSGKVRSESTSTKAEKA